MRWIQLSISIKCSLMNRAESVKGSIQHPVGVVTAQQWHFSEMNSGPVGETSKEACKFQTCYGQSSYGTNKILSWNE